MVATLPQQGTSATPPKAPEPAAAADEQIYRLYVSAASPVSSRAIVNARRFFECYLPGRHQLTVLDISENVIRAKADQVIVSPTLIRVSPLPLRRFIGDMSDVQRLRTTLGLAAAPQG